MKKTLKNVVLPVICLIIFCLAACTTGKPEKQTKTHESMHPIAEWEIKLTGIRDLVLKATGCYQKAKEHASHYRGMTLESKGKEHSYQGMPFHLVIAMADGTDEKHPFVFDKNLWTKGYDVTITGKDGYSVTFHSKDLDPAAMLLADMEDGKPVSPRIVGTVSKKYWVKDIAEINLGLEKKQAAEINFALKVRINKTVTAYPIKDLEKSPYFTEEKGSYTTSAGTKYSGKYGGIKIADFLRQYVRLKDETTVILKAMDGYEMNYNGKDIMDESQGVWILAFKKDGQYLPKDPGYIRTIKIGSQNPNIEGHLSVRMIAEVIVSEDVYRDFSLTMEGKLNFQVDRQTMQAGISCHKKHVDFIWKDRENKYTGIPLWRMLAYSDDEKYAPHKQDSSIISYKHESALKGYKVVLTAGDGYHITLDSKFIHKNEDLILAMYKNNKELPDNEWPLILVWDKGLQNVPQNVKPIRQIAKISLIFD